MKMIVIASVLAGTLALSQNTYANPQPSHQGAHMQVEEWINSLRGLSLNSTQKAQIKALFEDFREAQEKPDRPKMIDSETLADASAETIRNWAEERVKTRHEHGFALATFRHQVFESLNEEQQAKIVDRLTRLSSNKPRSRKGKNMKGPKRMPSMAMGIMLTDEQKEALKTLDESQKDSGQLDRELMQRFMMESLTLVHSDNFSIDTWNTLMQRYYEDMVSLEEARMTHQQMRLAIFTQQQREQLDANREEVRSLRELFAPPRPNE